MDTLRYAACDRAGLIRDYRIEWGMIIPADNVEIVLLNFEAKVKRLEEFLQITSEELASKNASIQDACSDIGWARTQADAKNRDNCLVKAIETLKGKKNA